MRSIWPKQVSSKTATKGRSRLRKRYVEDKKNDKGKDKGVKAISHNNLHPEASEVTLKSDGSVDCILSVAEVVKMLGLTGTGINQFVGIRSNQVLSGTGLAQCASSVKILALSPLTAKILVQATVVDRKLCQHQHNRQDYYS